MVTASGSVRLKISAIGLSLVLAVALSLMSLVGGGVALAADRFASLDEAIAAGVLDPTVAESLDRQGSADAIVTLDDTEVVRRAAAAESTAPNQGEPGEGDDDEDDEDDEDEAPRDRVGAAIRAAVSDLRRPVIRALTQGGGGSVLRQYDNVPALFVRFTSRQSLLAVVNRPEVRSVQAEVVVTASTVESGSLVRQPQSAAAGFTGHGATVAVLDTGVDYRRSAFGACTAPGAPTVCRVVASRDIAADDSKLDDSTLHGSNVSGITAAIASGAKLAVLDVFRSDGTAVSSEIIAAMDWVIGNRTTYNIRAVNLSLGSGAYTTSCPADPGFRTAMAAAVVPVVAAGNSGATSGVGWPACVADAIAVGAVYDANLGARSYSTCSDPSSAADRITCFSQSGPNLDILAPGAIITAADISMAGTSQAAPHVAAGAGIVAAAVPAAKAADVRAALLNNGPQISDARNGVTVRRLDLYAAVTALAGAPSTPPPPPPGPPPGSPPSPQPGAGGQAFTDTAGHPFEQDIRWLADAGITSGCSPSQFCPDRPVNREQMASFLARAFHLPAASRDFFSDDEQSLHEDDINRLAQAGIATGCGPQRYCPTDIVNREQMASFLARAFALPPTGTDFFTDDEGSLHETDINRLAASGITGGCGPGRYCPLNPVTRGQMAAFLHRGLA